MMYSAKEAASPGQISGLAALWLPTEPLAKLPADINPKLRESALMADF